MQHFIPLSMDWVVARIDYNKEARALWKENYRTDIMLLVLELEEQSQSRSLRRPMRPVQARLSGRPTPNAPPSRRRRRSCSTSRQRGRT